MKLTKEMVDCLLAGTEASLPIEMPMSEDICKDNLAMREMLEKLEWAGTDGDACPWCGRYKTCGHKPDCKLKELLG